VPRGLLGIAFPGLVWGDGLPVANYHLGATLHTNRFLASCSSWDDFYERTKALPTHGGKGAVFERLTQLYLQTTPEYRTEIQQVWKLRDVPPDVRRRLHLPAPDEGIDLLARTRHGVKAPNSRRLRGLSRWLRNFEYVQQHRFSGCCAYVHQACR
jgi:hypothetical protein